MLKAIIAMVTIFVMACFMVGTTSTSNHFDPQDGAMVTHGVVGRRARFVSRLQRRKAKRAIDKIVTRTRRTIRHLNGPLLTARGESKKNAMFHPTQPKTLDFIARRIKINIPDTYMRRGPQQVLIGDTSLGDGVTLANLKQLIIKNYQGYAVRQSALDSMIHLVGVEPNMGRARKARSQGIKVLVGTLEETRQVPDVLDIAFCNPPYDDDAATGGRTEESHLKMTLQFLRSKGLFILIVRRVTLQVLAKTIATYGYDIEISNYEQEEEEEFDQVVVWFKKRNHSDVLQYGTDDAVAEKLVAFSRRETHALDLVDMFAPYKEDEMRFNDQVRVNSSAAPINARTQKVMEPFGFSKQSNISYEEMVKIAYSDTGLLGRERDALAALAFQRGRIQEHRGIREDQLALVLGAGIGEYIPALFRDPRSGRLFNGILRVTSKDGEQVISVDTDLGIEKVRRIQKLVSTVYDCDEKQFISLTTSKSSEETINQRSFLTDNWNARAIQELITANLKRTFEPPSLEELLTNSAAVAAKKDNPADLMRVMAVRRLLGQNFRMRLMYNQYISALNVAELLERGDPAFLIAEQGSGKSKTYMGAMELAKKSSILMVVPEQLTAVLARELAETLDRVKTFSMDTKTLNNMRMTPTMVLPHEWEDIIHESYPDVELNGERLGVRTYWEDEAAGVLVVDFSNASEAPDDQSFSKFVKARLDSPMVTGANGGFRLVHDFNPVNAENLRKILSVLPEDSSGFLEHSESMRFTVPSGADRPLLNAAAKAVAGAKAEKITFTQFCVRRSRPVSRDPVTYLFDAARAAEKSVDNPVYVLTPFTMLTKNHTKVSSLQTWRTIEQETLDVDDTLNGERMLNSKALPALVNAGTKHPLEHPSMARSEQEYEALTKEFDTYKAMSSSRMGLACPECLTMVREKVKGVEMLVRPGLIESNPMMSGTPVANLIDGDGIGDYPTKYSAFLEKVAVTRAKNHCTNCDAPLAASYYQQAARSKGKTTVRHNDSLAAIEYLTSARMKGAFDCVIFDEAHKVKGMDSARGIAGGKICDLVPSVVLGTATFNNGYAASLFRHFRNIPEFREEYEIDEDDRFQEDFGFIEFTRELTVGDATHSTTSNRKQGGSDQRNIPGVKGEFIKWLLPYMVSMKLHDVREMCDLDEFLVALDTEEDLFASYKNLLGQLEILMKSAINGEDGTTVKRAVSDMRNLGITLLNAPYRGVKKYYPRPGIEALYEDEPLPDPSTLTEEEYYSTYYPCVSIAPSYKNKLTRKEQRLLRLFEDGLEEDPDAKFLTFVWYTGKLNYVETEDEDNLISRLNRLGNPDINMSYLGDGVPTANRTAFIEDLVANGTQVVFVNPRRVAEGVTLNMMTNVVFFETPAEPAIKSQAARRSYRLNQSKDIKVFVMYYSQTVQELEMALLQNKDAVDRIISGETPAVDEMARDIVNPDDALLMIVRQQVLNGKADLPEHLRAQQPSDTSLLLTQRSYFIGDEEYVHRMRGVSLPEWVATEYQHLKNYMEEPYRHASWLGFSPPVEILEVPQDVDIMEAAVIDAFPVDESIPVGAEATAEALPKEAVVLDPPLAPDQPTEATKWYGAFNSVEEIEPVLDDDPEVESKRAEPVSAATAWADAFFGGSADQMAVGVAKPKRRKRRNKADQMAAELEVLENWKALAS